MSSHNPSGLAILVNGSMNLPVGHIGGVAALTAASVGAISITSSAGATLATIPAGSPAGVYPIATSGGAASSVTLANPADAGKLYLALLGVGTTA